MKRIALLTGVLALLWPALVAGRAGVGASDTDTADSAAYRARLERKAVRAVGDEEWGSANAIYTRLVELSPACADYYAGAMTTAAVAGDTVVSLTLVENAMDNLIPADTLFNAIERRAFAIGHPALYPELLRRIRQSYPYLGRIVDRDLLAYYIFRNNGPEIVRYAQTMLEPLPDNIDFLRLLARGYMLMGRDRDAVGAWRRVLQLDADNYDTLVDLGNYYMVSGDAAAGRQLLDRAEALRYGH